MKEPMRIWSWSSGFVLCWIVGGLIEPGDEGRSAETVWNLATAFLFAALLFGGWRAWLLAVLANGLVGWLAGQALSVLALAPILPTVYLAPAVYLRTGVRSVEPLSVVICVAVVGLASIPATLARELAQVALGLTAPPARSPLKALLSVALGDVVAILSICPALLLTLVPALRRRALRGVAVLPPLRRAAGIALGIVLITAAAAVIAIDLDDDPWYLFFVPLIYGAMVFGLLGGAVTSLAVNTAIVMMKGNELLYESQLGIEVSMLCFAAMALLLGAVTGAQRRATRRIRELNAGLEATVAMRTAQSIASEQAALVALAMKQRFISAASHDLRQPLAALSLTLDSILRRGKLDPGDPQAIELKGAVSTLVGALDTVLDLSRYEAGAVQAVLRPVSVAELVDSVHNDYRTLARHKGLAFTAAPTDAWIASDLMLARRAIGNLVDNALRYTVAGAVDIAIEADEDSVTIAVADTGPGMSADMLAAMRHPYQRGDGDIAMLSAGWGLGLAIVEQICRQLDLTLAVTSEPGRGSRFSIRFPRSQPGLAVPLGAGMDPAGALRNLRLLVIEDDAAVARALGETLRDAGAAARVVHDAPAALAAMRDDMPDVILSDYVIRGSADGVDIIRQLRQAAQADDLPAVLLSGVVADGLIRIANEERIALLAKPVDAERLIRTVEAAALGG
jgi:signal transduction histidine kinase/CheY-like chemotaxis protein